MGVEGDWRPAISQYFTAKVSFVAECGSVWLWNFTDRHRACGSGIAPCLGEAGIVGSCCETVDLQLYRSPGSD